MSMSKKRVALVIGSGGIKCAAAIGMWKVLQNEIPVDLIVGCSGGSIYSAVISRGGSVEYMAESSKEIWTTDIMQGYTTNLRATRDGSLKFNERSGLVDDSFLNKALEKVAFDLSFDDVEIPLKIIANWRENNPLRRQDTGCSQGEFGYPADISTLGNRWQVVDRWWGFRPATD